MAYNNRRNTGNQTPGGPDGQQRGKFGRLNQGGMQTRPGMGSPRPGMGNMNQGPNQGTGRASQNSNQFGGNMNQGPNPNAGRASQNNNQFGGRMQTRPGMGGPRVPNAGIENRGGSRRMGTPSAGQLNNFSPNKMGQAPSGLRSYGGGIRPNTGNYNSGNSNNGVQRGKFGRVGQSSGNTTPGGRNYHNNDYNEGY